MTEMVYGTIPSQVGDPILPKWWETVDKLTATFVVLLLGIGLLLGYASSPPLAERNGLDSYFYVNKQLLFGGLSIAVMLVISMMPVAMVRRLAIIGFIITFAAVAALPVLGTDFGKGAVRWYSLGFASVQPSEFLKPGFIVFAAWLLSTHQDFNAPPGRLYSGIFTLIIVVMLAAQPDFGQAAIILFVWGVMYFIGGAPMYVILGILGVTVLGGMFAYDTSEHFAGRIDGFLNTSIDPRTQLGYATNAIREGGLWGVGVGEGQVKWYLPDAHTDFIIAVAAEEFGLISVLCIAALYAAILISSLKRLMNERDLFVRLAGLGLLSAFIIQAIINMGVAVRLLPAKGMTLPFVSYGGSSLIASGIAMGMLLALTRERPQGEMGAFLMRRGRT